MQFEVRGRRLRWWTRDLLTFGTTSKWNVLRSTLLCLDQIDLIGDDLQVGQGTRGPRAREVSNQKYRKGREKSQHRQHKITLEVSRQPKCVWLGKCCRQKQISLSTSLVRISAFKCGCFYINCLTPDASPAANPVYEVHLFSVISSWFLCLLLLRPVCTIITLILSTVLRYPWSIYHLKYKAINNNAAIIHPRFEAHLKCSPYGTCFVLKVIADLIIILVFLFLGFFLDPQ